MSRRAKGPRLYLRKGRVHARTGHRIPDVYYIRDGEVEISTGCGADRLLGPDGAEGQLKAYIDRKLANGAAAALRDPTDAERRSDPSKVLIAEVLALYAAERAPHLEDPAKAASRLNILLEFWTEGADKAEEPLRPLYLTDVRRSRCKSYVAWRIGQGYRTARHGAALEKQVTAATARRELEDLSAAIAYWTGEHNLTSRPKVTLPEKPDSPRDALTRSQAAALLWAAMGWRRGADGRWTRHRRATVSARMHLRRFVLIGLYTGSRPGVSLKLLWEASPSNPWVDLDTGTVYRRGRNEREHATKRRPLVKIPARLLAHMRRWRRMDLERMAERQREGLKTTNAVMHMGGKALRRVPAGYAGIVADAGLPAEITPHWQRHTCATWLMQAGVEMWDAAAYAGMTVATLEKHYAHQRPEHQAAARKAAGRGGRRLAVVPRNSPE